MTYGTFFERKCPDSRRSHAFFSELVYATKLIHSISYHLINPVFLNFTESLKIAERCSGISFITIVKLHF